MTKLIYLFSGFLFGAGMIISGMGDPAKVSAFLDVYGAWSYDLIFVMGGALMVFSPSYWLLIHKRSKALNQEDFAITPKKDIDQPLLIGASLFGAGWAIAGICPGPAISSLALGNTDIFAFITAMVVGMLIGQQLLSRSARQANLSEQA